MRSELKRKGRRTAHADRVVVLVLAVLLFLAPVYSSRLLQRSGGCLEERLVRMGFGAGDVPDALVDLKAILHDIRRNVRISILSLSAFLPPLHFLLQNPFGRDGADKDSPHMMHDGRQVIGVRRGRNDKGGPSVLVQRLEVLSPGPAMELDDAVEAIDKAGEEEKATPSDVGAAG